MRSLLIVCLVACVALVAGTANAAGQISDNALAQMGLAGLQTMSDVQGTEIRGMGFAAVADRVKAGGASAAGLAVAAGPATGTQTATVTNVAIANVDIRIGGHAAGPGWGVGGHIGVNGPVAVSVASAVSHP